MKKCSRQAMFNMPVNHSQGVSIRQAWGCIGMPGYHINDVSGELLQLPLTAQRPSLFVYVSVTSRLSVGTTIHLYRSLIFCLQAF